MNRKPKMTFQEAVLDLMRYRQMVFDEFGRVRWVWSDTPVELTDDPEVKKLLEAHAKNGLAQTSFAPDLMRGRK